jgi:lipopolysaccharide export system protein LptC
VRSHMPVSIVRGQDHFNADSLSYDNLGRVVELTGRVKATVAPRPKDLP